MGQTQGESRETASRGTCRKAKLDILNLEARLLGGGEIVEFHIERVIGEGVQAHVGAYAREPQVVGVETPGGAGTVEAVVLHRTVAHDERVDADVEGLLGLGGVLGGKGVEGKLEVGGAGGILAIEAEMGGEHLCRGYAHATLDELPRVDAHGKTGGAHHGLPPLVVDGGVVDDNAVEESQIHSPYLDAGVEGGGKHRRHARRHGSLDIGYM